MELTKAVARVMKLAVFAAMKDRLHSLLPVFGIAETGSRRIKRKLNKINKIYVVLFPEKRKYEKTREVYQ